MTNLAKMLAAAVTAGCPLSAAAAPMVTFIEQLELYPYGPLSLNEHGDVVGAAYIWSGNKIDGFAQHVALQPLDGEVNLLTEPDYQHHLAYTAINDEGTVLVTNVGAPQGLNAHLLHPDGSTTPMESLTSIALNSAISIGNNNVVVGAILAPQGGIEAYRWTADEGYTLLGSMGGSTSSSMDINDHGTVVGVAELPHGSEHSSVAFRYTDSDGMISLGAPVGGRSTATAVNNHDVIVGTNSYAEDFIDRAFIYDDEHGMQSLANSPDIISFASDINDSNWVVGQAGAYEYWESFGFLWTPEEGMIDLNTLLPESFIGTIRTATAINNDGVIIGLATDGNLAFTYRLHLGAIPTPGALWPMFGAGALLWSRRRRRRSRIDALI